MHLSVITRSFLAFVTVNVTLLILYFLAHCINEVASTLRKRGEDKYLSVEVDVSKDMYGHKLSITTASRQNHITLFSQKLILSLH